MTEIRINKETAKEEEEGEERGTSEKGKCVATGIAMI